MSLFTRWLPHLGTELEIAQRHLDGGDEVSILSCAGCLKACDGNRGASILECKACAATRLAGVKRLSRPPAFFRLDDYLSAVDERAATEWFHGCDTVEDFKHAALGEDLGWGAVSSTVSALRDPRCDTAAARWLLKQFGAAAFRSYRATQAFLKSQPAFDVAYIFNGRFAVTRGAWRACREAGLAVRFHERGSAHDRFSLYDNDLTHSVARMHEKMLAAWSDANAMEAKIGAGHEFFANRRRGVIKSWMSFTDQQKADLLPDGWNPDRRNIVIFNSSEDEFAAIGDEWRNPFYRSQNEAIRRIVEASRDRWPNTHFTVRVHPNLRDVANADLAELLAMEAPNLTVVPPDSSVDSYALLDQADAVLTFGSTMGVEATYWGKPSIVAGPCFYMHLDAAYHPGSHDEVMELLGTSLPAKPQSNALVYGSYMHTFGIPYRYWEADGRLDGVFRGLRLSEARARSLRSLAYRLHRWKWSTYRVLRGALDAVGLVPAARRVKHALFRRSGP